MLRYPSFHLLAVTLLLAAPIPAMAATVDTAPKHVIILYADDWRYNTLSCAGNPIVRTPNLDRLASEGIRFTRACVTTSICGVSRASLITGQWMSRHGNSGFKAFKTPWNETCPGILRANGYWTGLAGKWHNGPFPKDHYDFGRSYSGTHWIKEPDGSRIHVTRKNERDALEFLRTRPKDKPFAFTVSFFAAHAEDGNPEQYLPQPESMSLYKNEVIPIPETATDDDLRRLPPFLSNEKNEGRNRWHWRFDTPEKYQKSMKNYYRLATEVDAACGTILEELKTQGILDDTLIVFTGDNGYFHGEKGLADKWYPYEESIRVPLIVRDPRLDPSKKGTTNDEFVLNVDIAPTLLAFAGHCSPARMQGRDFSPLYLKDEHPAWRKEFFYEHAVLNNKDFIPASEALVRKDMKYIYWPDHDAEELFNLTKDPIERFNVIADPVYRETLAEMKHRLRELREQAR